MDPEAGAHVWAHATGGTEVVHRVEVRIHVAQASLVPVEQARDEVNTASALFEVQAAAHVHRVVHAVWVRESDPGTDADKVERVRGMRNGERHKDGSHHE